MKSTIKWIAGVLLILAGLGGLVQGAILSAILYLLAGIICLPPVMKLLEEKLSRNFQTWQKYLAVIGCLILGGIAMPKTLTDGSSNRQSNTSYSSQVEETVTPEQAAQRAKEERDAKIQEQKSQTVSASELSDIYQSNEVKADENYKGKKFYVKGSVMEIKKDIMDNPYVLLRGDGVLRNVQCFFEDASVISNLNKGQKITVYGKCEGLMMSVMMKNCQIAENL